MKTVLAVVGGVVLLVIAFVAYKYVELSREAEKYKDAKEVVSESIEKDGTKWNVKFESVIAKPIDKVWAAMHQPERSAEFIDSFKKSELKKNEGNEKVVEIQVQVLTLPLQTFLADFHFDDADHQMMLKTLSGPQDLNAVYQLRSLGSDRTLLTYNATATDKVSVPLPLSVQKGAVRELFVKTIQAIEKGIEANDKERQQKAG